MSVLKKLAGQTAVYGFSSIVGRLLNYLLVPIYTRVFSQAEYGVVSELYSYTSFLLILFTFGMETAFFNFMQKEEDSSKVYSTSVSAVLYTSLLLAGGMVLFNDTLAGFIKYPNHPEYITWLALIIAFDAIAAIPFARLRQQNRAKRFAAIKLINIFANIGFTLFFLVLCPWSLKLNAGILTQIANTVYAPGLGLGYVFISNLLASGITLLLMWPEFKAVHYVPDLKMLKRMAWYAFPLLIAGFAGMINETFDRVVYKYLAPNPKTALAELGVYSACYKLSVIMTLFIQTFRYAAEPFFFAQHKNNSNKRNVYAHVMKYFIITCSFIFTGVMLYIDVIKLFIGEGFRSGLAVVPILLMANLCLGIFYNLSMWYKLTGQTRYGAWFAMAGAAATLLLLILLIPVMGYMGAAWATLITYAFMMVLSYITGQRHYPIPYDVAGCLMYIGMALLVYFSALGIQALFALSGLSLFAVNTVLLLFFAYLILRLNKPLAVGK